jgi:hypothetical protein
MRIERRSSKALNGSLSGTTTTSTVEDCEKSCRAEDKCVGYTFVKLQKQCKRFSGIDNVALDNSASSGIKRQSPQ